VAGEGGVVATNSDELADAVRKGREYGMAPGYDSQFAGMNSRMSEFHACLGRHSLAMLELNVERRQQLANAFRRGLGGLPGIGFQEVRTGNRSSYKDFSITIDASQFGLNRDEVAKALAAENIDSRKYYSPPVHRQTAYRQFSPSEELLATTNELASTCLSLPVWSHMGDEIVTRICESFRKISNSAPDVRRRLADG
jgi:dTDP-4-amino-4,6-dideoxygalactose transaminase